jgi:hypothetical protein
MARHQRRKQFVVFWNERDARVAGQKILHFQHVEQHAADT